MFPLTLLKPLLGAFCVAGVVFWALHQADSRGYERRDAESRIEQAELAAEYSRIKAENVIDAQLREESIQRELASIQDKSAVRIQSLGVSLKAQEQAFLKAQSQALLEISNETPLSPPSIALLEQRPTLGAAVLDEPTVRLLDDARANRSTYQVGSAGTRTDAQIGASAAPAPVTGSGFASNDLEVVRLYHQLAARHDRLIDWVNNQCLNSAQPLKTP